MLFYLATFLYATPYNLDNMFNFFCVKLVKNFM